MLSFIKNQKISVSALVVNEKGQLLLVRRTINDSRPGEWEFPGGGIEFGENPMDATIREVKEETGLDVNIAELTSVKSAVYGNGNKQIFRIMYACMLTDINQEVVLSKEHSAYQWINISEIQPANQFYLN